MKYSTILLDLDNTLFDTHRAEKGIIASLVGQEVAEMIYPDYTPVVHQCWKEYAEGKLSREALRPTCFSRLQKIHGFSGDPVEIGEGFERGLRNVLLLFDDTVEALKLLQSSGVKIYSASNGIGEVQRHRLEASGLLPFFTSLFVSSDLGFAKPQKEFFDKILDFAHVADPAKVIMIGDEEKTDIAGAHNAGLSAARVHYDSIVEVNTVAEYQGETLTDIVQTLLNEV